MSEPKLAVSNEVKPDLVRVDVCVEVGTAAATSNAVALAMEDVEVACNATALELAEDGEYIGCDLTSKYAHEGTEILAGKGFSKESTKGLAHFVDQVDQLSIRPP